MAARYDQQWTRTAIGRLQRDAVWRRVDPLFHPGDAVLDLGCGTGEDALHLMSAGVRVTAIDASSEMVAIARSRGVDASHLAIEESDRLDGRFDGVLSNFGALNCVENLASIRAPLARLVRPGGHLALCLMGRFCLWETAWFLLHGEPSRAFRRWSQDGVATSLGIRVHYPSIRQIERAFAPAFRLIEWHGIGIAVPPSYVTGLSDRLLERLARFDTHAHWLRAFSDHRLLIFVRE